MTLFQRGSRRRGRRSGAIIVLFSVLLVVIVAMLALAIDVGYLYTVRTDLQRAADASALAGAAELAGGPQHAVSDARKYARKNTIGRRELKNEDINVQLGQWDWVTHQFVSGGEPFDAVRVVVERPDTPTFFTGARGGTQVAAQSIAVIRPRDIMLVLDYSGSMNSLGKIQALKDAVRMFLGYLKENAAGIDRVGFVVYSTYGEMVIPLTHDLDLVESAVLMRDADGYTNIGEGMQLAREELERNGRVIAHKMAILMTDGLANRPQGRDPKLYVLDEAQLAKDAGLPIATISFATGADKKLMGQVALLTGGVHFHVEGKPSAQAKELRSVFLQIAKTRPPQLVE